MFSRIFCATDGSRVSEKAVAFAVALAKMSGGHYLTFLTVETVSAEIAARSAFWDATLLSAADAQVRHELTAAVGLARQQGLTAVDFATVQGRHIGKAVAYYAPRARPRPHRHGQPRGHRDRAAGARLGGGRRGGGRPLPRHDRALSRRC